MVQPGPEMTPRETVQPGPVMTPSILIVGVVFWVWWESGMSVWKAGGLNDSGLGAWMRNELRDEKMAFI